MKIGFRSTLFGRMSRWVMLPVFLAAALGSAPLSTAHAIGSTITVDTLNGGLVDGNAECSLAEAIVNANDDAGSPYADCTAGAGDDDIVFSVSGTIALTQSLPIIDDPDNETTHIIGAGTITIDGANTWQVIRVSGFATLRGLVVARSNNAFSGANRVESTGNLTVEDSQFNLNHAGGNGGGMYLDGGTLNVVRSTFEENDADFNGGAVYINAGTATFTNSTFRQNEATFNGGAIYTQASLNLYNNTFTLNSSAAGSGAALHLGAGTTEVYNSILADSVGGTDCYKTAGTLSAEYDLMEVADATCLLSDGVDGNIIGHEADLGPSSGTTPLYYLLSSTSLAIDAGDNGRVPGGVITDQAGSGRFDDAPWLYDTGSGTAPIVDMGSYEYEWSCGSYSRVYVDADHIGNGDGLGWSSALRDLQHALAIAAECTGAEVWVAEGVYRPDGGGPGNLNATFMIPPDANVYGGFDGTETMLSEQDWQTNVTVLSGDIEDNDTNVDGNNIAEDYTSVQGSNSYHVVFFDGTITPITGGTALDGFVITGGQANSAGINGEGGGILCLAPGASDICSPQLTNLLISGNIAADGGGMFIEAGVSSSTGSPTLQDVTFRGNWAGSNGGGVFNHSSGVGNPSLTNVTFSNNSAGGHGGGLVNAGSGGAASPSLENVTFHSNSAAGNGGGMWNVGYGGVNGISSPVLKNVTFTGNSAYKGGGMENQTLDPSSVSSPVLYNVILWADSATTSGDEIMNEAVASSTVNPSLDHVIVQGGCPAGSSCANLSTADPMLGSLQDNGGFTETVALLAGSSAIDTGDAGNCSSPDQRWVTRPRGAECDIGAFERIPPFSDFDYDDMTDPAKFVPGTGMAWWLKSSTDLWDSAALGGDVASYVSRSDFNGDGQTDPGKYVAAGQALYYLLSPSYAAWDGEYMGTGSYSLLPGSDFDGDQTTDPAKYQSDGSVWRLLSGTSTWAGTFIGTDAAPTLPGSDYDGDGMTDVAKYVAAGAIWYLGSSDSTWHGQYIGADGTPVPASDFDGDGITDTAKYLTGSNVLWWLGSNSGAWTGVYLGPGASIPVPAADFDGDGKTDPARFDTGGKALWWLRSSDGGLDGAYMGPETYEIVN